MVALPLFERVSFFINRLWITFIPSVNYFFMTVDNLTNFSLSDLWKTFLFYDRIREQE